MHGCKTNSLEWRKTGKMSETHCLVSVIVTNYNGAHLLPKCLSSLKEQDYPYVETIVVDNGSVDGSKRLAKVYGVEFIELGYNYGLSVACNRGAQISTGKYLFFTNNDMRFEQDCVSQLIKVISEENDSVFAVDPLQYNWKGNKIIHYKGVLTGITSLKSIFSQMFLPLPPLMKTYVPSQKIAEVPWGCAGSLMVRRDMFETLAGFDETFFMDFEDTDLCWRAWLRGWRTLFVPQAKLYHKWGASTDEKTYQENRKLIEKLPQIVFRKMVSQQKNHQRFALKILDPLSIILIFSVKLVSVFLYPFIRKAVVSIGILKAFFLTLKELPDTLNSRKQIKETRILSNRQIISRFWNKKAPTALIWPSSDVVSREKPNPVKISVIVPTYRRPEYLKRCLKGLARQTRKPDEVIVVVREIDSDSRQIITTLQTEYEEAFLLKRILVSRTGKSVAINAGLEAATGDIICFTDDDAEPHPNWVERIVQHFRDPTLAGVGGRDVIIKNGKVVEGKCKVVGRMSWFGRYIGNHHLELESGETIKVDLLKGTNMAFRANYLEGFRLDENLMWQGAAHDEMDFCLFVKKKGGKIIFDPNLRVNHYVAPRYCGAERNDLIKSIYENSHNYTYLIFKHFSWPRKLAFFIYFFLVGQRSSWGLLAMLIDPILTGRITWWKQVVPSFKGKVEGIRTYLKHHSQDGTINK